MLNSVVHPQVRELTAAQQAKAKAKFARQFKIVEFPLYPIGARVCVRDAAVGPNAPKSHGKWFTGTIAGYGGFDTYIVRDRRGELLDRPVPVNQLKPGPKKATEDLSQEVRKVIGHRFHVGVVPETARQDQVEYRVVWKSGLESWVPTRDFDTLECIHEYWARSQDALKPMSLRRDADAQALSRQAKEHLDKQGSSSTKTVADSISSLDSPESPPHEANPPSHSPLREQTESLPQGPNQGQGKSSNAGPNQGQEGVSAAGPPRGQGKSSNAGPPRGQEGVSAAGPDQGQGKSSLEFPPPGRNGVSAARPPLQGQGKTNFSLTADSRRQGKWCC